MSIAGECLPKGAENFEENKALKGEAQSLQLCPTLQGKAVILETEHSLTILMNFFRIAQENLSITGQQSDIEVPSTKEKLLQPKN